ncbi:MAG: TolC family protein [Vicinamibacteraceae bacterium]|nr:TolC family protein [Vicinamibacteraceae bacterium]
MKRRALAVVAVLISAGPVWSQDSGIALSTAAAAAASRMAVAVPSPAALTLEACLAAALAHDGRGKAAAHGVEAAAARFGQARSSRYPSVSARMMATRLDEDPNFIFPSTGFAVPAGAIDVPATLFMLPANALGPGLPPINVPLPVPGATVQIPAQTFHVPAQDIRLMDKTLFSGSLGAMYALYTGGLAGARIEQAEAGVEAAREERRQTLAEIQFDVTRTYYGIVLARKLHRVASDTWERMQVTLELTESLYKTGSGRVKKTDYLRHSAMVDTIASMVAEIEAQERVARAALAVLIGWREPGDPEVADLDFPPEAPSAWAAPVEHVVERNPTIGQALAGLAALHAGITAARAGHLPKVGLFADLHLIGNSYNAGAVTPQNKTTWAVGIGVEVPIFQGFRVAKEVEEARAAHRQLEQQLAALRDGIALEARRATVAIDKSVAQHATARRAYASATENRELHVRAYQDELVETKDMIESQLVEAVLAAQFFRVQYDLVDARARLDLLVGSVATGSR